MNEEDTDRPMQFKALGTCKTAGNSERASHHSQPVQPTQASKEGFLNYWEQFPLESDASSDTGTGSAPHSHPRLRGTLRAIWEPKALATLTPEQHAARLDLMEKYCSNRGIQFLRAMYLSQDNASEPAAHGSALLATKQGKS